MMAKPRIHLVAGARPNFMKIAPLWHALAGSNAGFDVAIVHTGQHYDDEMSEVFLRQFRLPKPDYALGCGGGSHAEQTAGVMTAYERVCLSDRPDWVIVVGDVNSTMATTLAAKKLMLKVAHLEAGLRSFDRTMPEEINRLVTDALRTCCGRRRRTATPTCCAKALRRNGSSASATS
jgi:UDP-N-acetylglucosamine 2-epimerase (non-hydrolysing)